MWSNLGSGRVPLRIAPNSLHQRSPVAAVHHLDHSGANLSHRRRRHFQSAFRPHLVSTYDFIVEGLDLLHEAGLIKGPAIADNGDGLGHLHGRNLDVPLANRHVGDVPIQDLSPVGRFHVFVRRHAAFYFAS